MEWSCENKILETHGCGKDDLRLSVMVTCCVVTCIEVIQGDLSPASRGV